MSPNDSFPVSNSITAAVEKYYSLNDDLDDVQAITRKMFFEFLRTKPTLTTEEIDSLNTVVTLLAELNIARRAKIAA